MIESAQRMNKAKQGGGQTKQRNEEKIDKHGINNNKLKKTIQKGILLRFFRLRHLARHFTFDTVPNHILKPSNQSNGKRKSQYKERYETK